MAYTGFSAAPSVAPSIPTGEVARQSPAWTVVGGQPTQPFPHPLHSGNRIESKMSMNSRQPFKTDRQSRERELVKGR